LRLGVVGYVPWLSVTHHGAEAFFLGLEFQGGFAGEDGGDEAAGGAWRDDVVGEGFDDHGEAVFEALEVGFGGDPAVLTAPVAAQGRWS
jgi:hypothetical protein